MPYKDLDLRREKAKEYTRQYRAKNKKPKAEAVCPQCNNTFTLIRSNKIFCTRKCKTLAWEDSKKNEPYRGRDPLKAKLRALKYYHSDIETNRKKQLERQKRNLSLFKFHSAKRRAAKLQRTPPWADMSKIAAFYKSCPEGYHVDHIIPLQGKNVSGLHVIENLQYLPASENISKGNRYVDT